MIYTSTLDFEINFLFISNFEAELESKEKNKKGFESKHEEGKERLHVDASEEN